MYEIKNYPTENYKHDKVIPLIPISQWKCNELIFVNFSSQAWRAIMEIVLQLVMLLRSDINVLIWRNRSSTRAVLDTIASVPVHTKWVIHFSCPSISIPPFLRSFLPRPPNPTHQNMCIICYAQSVPQMDRQSDACAQIGVEQVI